MSLRSVLETSTVRTSAIALLLSACASAPHQPAQPGKVQVRYSPIYSDGSKLREEPLAVRIVKPEHAQSNIAQQVALNVVLFAFAGGLSVSPFGKNDLRGAVLTDADNKNIPNPIPRDFTARLDERINAAVQANEKWRTQRFSEPVLLQGGTAHLVYESLIGNDEQYRLRIDPIVFKFKEDRVLLRGAGTEVNCTSESPEPLPLSHWSADSYALVRTQLDSMLDACEAKVMAQLPEMLGS